MVEFRKKEQKKFIEKVASLNLNPNELVFELRDNGHQFRYLDSGIVFIIQPVDHRYDMFKYEYTLYTPNRQRVVYSDKPFYLSDILKNFDKWLREHVMAYIEENAAPDPWQVFIKDYSGHGGTEKFTEKEINELEEGLDRFPMYLAEKTTIQPDKYNAILDEVKELKKELKTTSKRKWGKRLTLFIIEEVWDAVKDELVMNQVKQYFFELVSKSAEYLPKLLQLLP